LQVESGQGRDLGREIVVGGAFAADTGDRQDQVADVVLLFQAAALSQEKRSFWLDGAQQVHDRGGVGAAHPKVDQGDPFGGGIGHGFIKPADGDVEPVREHVQVIFEVDQQYVLAELIQRVSV
jgi:hypothetical protein